MCVKSETQHLNAETTTKRNYHKYSIILTPFSFPAILKMSTRTEANIFKEEYACHL